MASIWTHGEYLRFATVKPGFISIWEVGFYSKRMPAMVESLSAPDDISCSEESLFLPTLSRFAFTLREAVSVWDARDSKLLLNFLGSSHPTRMSFSPDGRFFACGTTGQEIHVWKDSPIGYTLHQKLVFRTCGDISTFLSPTGESIIALNYSTVQLWSTKDPTPSLPTVPTRFSERTNFILEFSPDETLAAVVRLGENTVTVLDLDSGDPLLIVDTGTKVLGLGVNGSTVVIVGEGKVVTWNLPAGDRSLCARANISDSVQTTMFDYSGPLPRQLVPYTSISRAFNHFAATGDTVGESEGLNLYDIPTGKCLTGTVTRGHMPWFAPDGREVWCTDGYSAKGWTITEDSGSGFTKLERLGPTTHPSGGFPWRSSRDYIVTHDGWVLNPSRKRLLWLPHGWRSDEKYRTWGGRFLGLLHRELPEIIILELYE